MFQVKRTNNAKLPTKAHSGDAGWDLYSSSIQDIVVEPNSRAIIPTGCSFAIPEGYYGRIADRSGNACKMGVHVLAGVIDSQYRGEVKICLMNLDRDNSLRINYGDKIAQMIITKIHEGEMVEVEDLDSTERGADGFGSTGR